MERFSARAAIVRVGTLIDELVGELDLLRVLREEGPEGEDRAENIRELITGAVSFDAELIKDGGEDEEFDGFSELDLFLQQVALVSDIDQHDPDSDAVTLMTLHNAKGLEFPMVFIAGPRGRPFSPVPHLQRARGDGGRAAAILRRHHTCPGQALPRSRAPTATGGEIMHGRLSPFAEAIPGSLTERQVTRRLSSEAFTTASCPAARTPAGEGGGRLRPIRRIRARLRSGRPAARRGRARRPRYLRVGPGRGGQRLRSRPPRDRRVRAGGAEETVGPIRETRQGLLLSLTPGHRRVFLDGRRLEARGGSSARRCRVRDRCLRHPGGVRQAESR